MEEESLKYIYLQHPGALQRGLFLLIPKQGGSWSSKHPEPLSPSDAKAVPKGRTAATSTSRKGAALDLGGCLGAGVFAGSLAWLEEGSSDIAVIQLVPRVVWGFQGPPCQSLLVPPLQLGASGRSTAPGVKHSWDL